jgi:hypothetical protein
MKDHRAATGEFVYGNNAFFEFSIQDAGARLKYSATNTPNGASLLGDMWDILEYDGNKASYLGTADPTFGSWQLVTHTQGCNFTNYDAYVLFDQTAVSRDNATTGSSYNYVGSPKDGCTDQYRLSRWQTEIASFTNGKKMTTLWSKSYDHNTPAASYAYEKYVYTKPYGFTRWEFWCNPARTTCGAAEAWCNGANTDSDGFRRTACDELAIHVAHPDTGLNPLVMPLDARMAKGNLLVDGDLGYGQSYSGNWKAWDANTTMYVYQEALYQPPNSPAWFHSYNHYINAEWNGVGSLGGSVYQDVPRSSLPGAWPQGVGAKLSFGAKLWLPSGGTATAQVCAYELPQVTVHCTPATLTSARTDFAGPSFVVSDSTTTIRFQVFIPGNVSVNLDDAYLTRTN